MSFKNFKIKNYLQSHPKQNCQRSPQITKVEKTDPPKCVHSDSKTKVTQTPAPVCSYRINNLYGSLKINIFQKIKHIGFINKLFHAHLDDAV